MPQIYDKKNFRSREALGGLVGRTRKLMLDQLEQELAPFDISAQQSIVIIMLSECIASTAAEVCKTLSHDPGAMTRLLDKLESKGVVRRVRINGDRRKVRLELTPKGKALYPKIVDAQVNVFNRLLRGFTRAEAVQLEGMLMRLLENA